MAISLHLPTPSFDSLNLPDKHRCRLHRRCFLPSLPSLPIAASPPSSTSSFRRRRGPSIVSVGKEETELRPPQTEEELDASPDDEERVRDIQRVLELLRKNRDMLFSEMILGMSKAFLSPKRKQQPENGFVSFPYYSSDLFVMIKFFKVSLFLSIRISFLVQSVILQVKLTLMIEDPREAERKRSLGIEESNDVTRDDLAAALEDVNEGRIPENRAALQMLHEEMINWPNLEVAAEKRKPSRSLYARATDTGVDPKEAAKRLKIDWDSAAEIDESEESDELEVPPAVGYGALYLVTGLPVLIGISVVLILFYNSLQ